MKEDTTGTGPRVVSLEGDSGGTRSAAARPPFSSVSPRRCRLTSPVEARRRLAAAGAAPVRLPLLPDLSVPRPPRRRLDLRPRPRSAVHARRPAFPLSLRPVGGVGWPESLSRRRSPGGRASAPDLAGTDGLVDRPPCSLIAASRWPRCTTSACGSPVR